MRHTPKERLIHVIALLRWPALVGHVLGPPVGGHIADQGNWRWIFWLNLPLGIIAFFLAWKLVPTVAPDRDRSFDWPGFLLTGSALFCALLAAEMLTHADIDPKEALLALIVGSALMMLGVRHLRHAKQPMFHLHALGTPTFMAAIRGGSLFCMSITAIPFLVPLMLQIGLGFDAFLAGKMLMAVFVGNLVMKPMTTAVMRYFGIRRVLIVNGLINAVLIAACVVFSATTPLWLIVLILFLGGMARSLQFTAINTIAFSDLPQTQMASANTLVSTFFQLSMGLGVALGAIAWRIGDMALTSSADVTMPFRIAFIIVAVVSLLAVLDSIRLRADVGEHITHKKTGVR